MLAIRDRVSRRHRGAARATSASRRPMRRSTIASSQRSRSSPAMRVLDVACGTGGVALRAARAGAEVVGIDISATSSQRRAVRLRPRASRSGSTRATARSFRTAAGSSTPSRPPSARSSRPTTSAPPPSWHASAGPAAGLRSRRGRPTTGRRRMRGLGGRSSRAWTRASGRRRSTSASCSATRSTSSCRPANGAIEADSGEELWELASTSMPPLRAWLAEQSDEVRARAEQVYLEYLASGVLARNYVLVLGTRR